ncbi:hypothetical protein MES4922_620003 [Mesorhizobium ventifaucium]|uniref:Uncharacterized protein n=1 Tax=Mesorhizobium ventifaucium TaxID=666020 RepID=A0ABM9EDD7_9HYPH|nr:hypothetical protein MES4922_620003 [Mesorhizobium ventifaucium]
MSAAPLNTGLRGEHANVTAECHAFFAELDTHNCRRRGTRAVHVGRPNRRVHSHYLSWLIELPWQGRGCRNPTPRTTVFLVHNGRAASSPRGFLKRSNRKLS